jgi:hypothetical protein
MLLSFPNIWTVTHFQIISLLFWCRDTDLRSGEETETYNQISLHLFRDQPPYQNGLKFLFYFIVSMLPPRRFTSSA